MNGPLLFTILGLALSPLVSWGVPLALHTYAGNSVTANNALIEAAYAAAFQSFVSWRFVLPVFELDAHKLWQALKDTLNLPELSWGAEKLMQNAVAMQTLNAIVGVLKSLLSAVSAGLALCKVMAPNVPTSKIAGSDVWDGIEEVRKIAVVSGRSTEVEVRQIPVSTCATLVSPGFLPVGRMTVTG